MLKWEGSEMEGPKVSSKSAFLTFEIMLRKTRHDESPLIAEKWWLEDDPFLLQWPLFRGSVSLQDTLQETNVLLMVQKSCTN